MKCKLKLADHCEIGFAFILHGNSKHNFVVAGNQVDNFVHLFLKCLQKAYAILS